MNFYIVVYIYFYPNKKHYKILLQLYKIKMLFAKVRYNLKFIVIIKQYTQNLCIYLRHKIYFLAVY